MPLLNHVRQIKINPYKEKCSIIIPAAGAGKRMRSYGPKSLINISASTNIITHQLNILNSSFPKSEIIVVGGFEINRLMRNIPDNLIVVENERFEETNVLRSVGMGLRACRTNNVIIVYGDLVFNYLTFTVKLSDKTVLFMDTNHYMSEDEVGCVIHDDTVEHMCYGITNKWAQIAYITGKELKMLQELAWDTTKEKWFMFEAFNMMIDNGVRLQAVFPAEIQVVDIDRTSDLITARKILKC